MTNSQLDGFFEAARAMCDDSGHLVSVRYGSDPELPDRAHLVGLTFESGEWWLGVDPDDDSLVIAEHLTDGKAVLTPAPHDSPWQGALGRRPRWVWVMINQQGYMDGIQFEFITDKADNDQRIQMVALASAWLIKPLGSVKEDL